MYFDTKRGRHIKSGFMYFCTKCGHYHYSDSKIGRKHLKYYNPDISAAVNVLNTLTNPPYCYNPAIRELASKLHEKIIEGSKKGGSLLYEKITEASKKASPLVKEHGKKVIKEVGKGAVIAAKEMSKGVAIGTKELVEIFRKLGKYALTEKQRRELADILEVLWRSNLLDLNLSSDERKRRKQLMTLIKYGLIDPESLKQVISRRLKT